MSEHILSPRTLWAQDKHQVFVTFEVFEAKDVEVEFDDNRIKFKAVQETGQKYEVDFELFDNILPKECTEFHTPRAIQCKLEKANPGPFWPRLLKSTTKPHFLAVDFARWVDEDYEEEDPEAEMPIDPSAFMNMAQMGQFGADAGFDDDSDEEEEEEHERHAKDPAMLLTD